MKFLSFFFAFLFCSIIWAQAQTVEVVKIKGEAYHERKPLKVGSHIKEGQHVEVKKGFIQFKFSDGSKMLLKNGKAKVELARKDKNSIQLIKGTLFKAKSGATKFSVKTPKAVFAVRGTKFFLQEEEKSSYLCVCEGVVSVKNKRGAINIRKDEDIHVYSGQDLKKTKATIGMVNMAWDGFAIMGIPRSP